MKKLAMLALSVVLMFGFAACGDDDDELFTQAPNSVLKVNNLDQQRLILYAATGQGTGQGQSTLGKVLGGVGKGAQGWGVKGVSSTMGMFILNIVTEQDYRDSLGTGDPRIAASILVYVDATPATYSISTSPMGTGYIQYYNQTSNFVEIRGGAVEDNPSWYSAPYTVLRPNDSKRVYFRSLDHELFPVMKIERRGGQGGTTIVGLAERNLTSYAALYGFKDNSMFMVSISAEEATAALDTVAFLSVQNNAAGGRLMVGAGLQAMGTIYPTSLGREVVSGGDSAEYIVQMAVVGTGPSALTSSKRGLQFFFAISGGVPIARMDAEFEFEAGKLYILTIPGNAAANNVATILPVLASSPNPQ